MLKKEQESIQLTSQIFNPAKHVFSQDHNKKPLSLCHTYGHHCAEEIEQHLLCVGLNTSMVRHSLPKICHIGWDWYIFHLNLVLTFHQIWIAVESDYQHTTAFNTPFGLFKYNRMPMGISLTPATFQAYTGHHDLLHASVHAGLSGQRSPGLPKMFEGYF